MSGPWARPGGEAAGIGRGEAAGIGGGEAAGIGRGEAAGIGGGRAPLPFRPYLALVNTGIRDIPGDDATESDRIANTVAARECRLP